jgi:helicase
MSGRAGRAGRDDQGESILIVRNGKEKQSMLSVMSADIAPLQSCLGVDKRGFQRMLLEVVASAGRSSLAELRGVVENTLFCR